jgi:hypothetical protein
MGKQYTLKPKPAGDSIAADLIVGGPAIAEELGMSYRRLGYLVASGYLGDAVTHLGPKLLIASRSKLRAKLGLAPAKTTTAA